MCGRVADFCEGEECGTAEVDIGASCVGNDGADGGGAAEIAQRGNDCYAVGAAGGGKRRGKCGGGIVGCDGLQRHGGGLAEVIVGEERSDGVDAFGFAGSLEALDEELLCIAAFCGGKRFGDSLDEHESLRFGVRAADVYGEPVEGIAHLRVAAVGGFGEHCT